MTILPLLLAAWSVSLGTSHSRSSGPDCISGITFAGGNTFYAIADSTSDGHVGIYRYTINFDSAGSSVSSYSVGSRIQVTPAYDLESIAYDPGRGTVWIANETGSDTAHPANTIYECYPTSGNVLTTLTMPANFTSFVGNFGLESLTISSDGLTMWTANEESLTTDGPRSSYGIGSTNRIVKFTRPSVKSNQWTCEAMYAYVTQGWVLNGSYGTSARHGISDLCALPDGSLLVMERDCSSSSSGTGIWAGLNTELYYSIYCLTPEALAKATNVKDIASLKTGYQTTWWPVSKTCLVYNSTADSTCNYEGICLGPSASGAPWNTSLVLVSDAGDGNTYAKIRPNLLSGWAIREYSIDAPSIGSAEPVGTNFRCTNGAPITVTLDSAVQKPYTNYGDQVVTKVGWSLFMSNSVPWYTGTSNPVNFKPWFNNVRLAWNLTTKTVTDSDLWDHDSFESYDVGATQDSLAKWSGNCEVTASAYTPPTPPGYPLTKETHTQVLNAEETTCAVAGSTTINSKFDMMIGVTLPTNELANAASNAKTALAVGMDGRFYLWALVKTNEVWTKQWVRLSDTVYKQGEWVRVGVEFDYTSSPLGDAFCRVRLNGSICPTDSGVRSPEVTTSSGAWHYLANNRVNTGVTAMTAVTFGGLRLDDYTFEKATVPFEESGESTTAEGVPYSWFDEMGVPRNPSWKAGPKCNTLLYAYESGVNVYAEEPLTIKSISKDANGKVHIEFNGYKGDNPAVAYRIVKGNTLEELKAAKPLTQSEGDFEGDRGNWSSTWEGTPDESSASGFYKVEVGATPSK